MATNYKALLSPTAVNIGYTARDPRIDQSHYIKVLLEAGANPIRIEDDFEDYEDFILQVDGMLFTGGYDIDPSIYGEDPSPQTGPYDGTWDTLEIECMRLSKKHHLPTLANCRGLQVMNVAFGGTLYQDLIADHVTTFNHDVHPRIVNVTIHDDYIVKDSHLGRILGNLGSPHDELTFTLPVNSSHHQGVDRVGEGLQITARAFDNVIEGLEFPEERFFLGVQWHPEDLTSNHVLHDELIKQAQFYRDNR